MMRSYDTNLDVIKGILMNKTEPPTGGSARSEWERQDRQDMLIAFDAAFDIASRVLNNLESITFSLERIAYIMEQPK